MIRAVWRRVRRPALLAGPLLVMLVASGLAGTFAIAGQGGRGKAKRAGGQRAERGDGRAARPAAPSRPPRGRGRARGHVRKAAGRPAAPPPRAWRPPASRPGASPHPPGRGRGRGPTRPRAAGRARPRAAGHARRSAGRGARPRASAPRRGRVRRARGNPARAAAASRGAPRAVARPPASPAPAPPPNPAQGAAPTGAPAPVRPAVLAGEGSGAVLARLASLILAFRSAVPAERALAPSPAARPSPESSGAPNPPAAAPATPAAGASRVLEAADAAAGGGGATREDAPRTTRKPPVAFPAASDGRDTISVVEQIPSWVWYTLAALMALALAGLGLAAAAARRARHTEEAAAALGHRAITDPLTGALNRRGFEERLSSELARARRSGRPLAVAYLDVVGLKPVNDSYGHATGDRLLKATGRLLEANSRHEDAFARIGGDEWAVILPEQDAEGAQTYARRLLDRLPDARRELGVQLPWSLTVGWAIHPEDGDDGPALLAAADRRLYAHRGIELDA